VNRALETVEDVLVARRDDLERQVVIVAAYLALSHKTSLFPPLPGVAIPNNPVFVSRPGVRLVTVHWGKDSGEKSHDLYAAPPLEERTVHWGKDSGEKSR
jgi:hypothetical protein